MTRVINNLVRSHFGIKASSQFSFFNLCMAHYLNARMCFLVFLTSNVH